MVNQVTFGEITYLIELLQTQHDSLSKIMGLEDKERWEFLKASNTAIGANETFTEDDALGEKIMQEYSEHYNKTYEILQKLKNCKEEDVECFLHVLFPYKNIQPNDTLQAQDNLTVDEKIKQMAAFLNSPKTTYTSISAVADKILLFGHKSKEENRISIYECKDWIRHDFRLDTPDNPKYIDTNPNI